MLIVEIQVPKLASVLTQNLKDTPYCTVCEYAVKFIDYEISQNKTQEAILATLDKVCKIAPSSLQAQCNSVINTYGPVIIQLLLTEAADADKICKLIKLC